MEVGAKIGGGAGVGGVIGAATGVELEVGAKIGGGAVGIAVGIDEYEAIGASLFGGCCTQP
ncbi:MAG: hypothetical protein Q7J73_07925 [Dehalococcoidales bacterium]|nr:hypothetical protein [Dehalococcoidales bacterium]